MKKKFGQMIITALACFSLVSAFAGEEAAEHEATFETAAVEVESSACETAAVEQDRAQEVVATADVATQSIVE